MKDDTELIKGLIYELNENIKMFSMPISSIPMPYPHSSCAMKGDLVRLVDTQESISIVEAIKPREFILLFTTVNINRFWVDNKSLVFLELVK